MGVRGDHVGLSQGTQFARAHLARAQAIQEFVVRHGAECRCAVMISTIESAKIDCDLIYSRLFVPAQIVRD